MDDTSATPATTDTSAGTDLNASVLSEIANNGAMLNQALSGLNQALSGLNEIVLPVDKGGTGLDSVGVGDLLVGNTGNTYSLLTDVATGNALISGGIGSQPSWGKITPGHFSGTLPVANGGTGDVTLAAHGVLIGAGTSAVAVTGTGTAGQLLTSNGASADPTFQVLTDGIAGLISFPANQAYRFWINSPFACTITQTTTVSVSGTCTATFNINGTPLGGSANSVSTVQQAQTQSSANAVAVGNYIEVTLSSNSSCVGMSFMVKFTRP